MAKHYQYGMIIQDDQGDVVMEKEYDQDEWDAFLAT